MVRVHEGAEKVVGWRINPTVEHIQKVTPSQAVRPLLDKDAVAVV